MQFKIVAIRDRAADAFACPQFVVSIGGHVRGFADEVNRAADNNQLYQHPEDFDLYELGTYDDEAAKFDLLETPRMIAIGKDLVRSK